MFDAAGGVGSEAILAITGLLPSMRRSFFDQSRNLFRPGDVNSMAGARGFHRVSLGSRGVPTLEFGIDGSVFGRY